MSTTCFYQAELLNCEEAINVLDRDEQRLMCGAQKSAKVKLGEKAQFVQDYYKFKQAHGKKKAGVGVGGAMPLPRELTTKKFPKELPLVYAQEDVKTYMPPSVPCWRGNVRREWWCHCKPYDRVWEPVDERHGGDGRKAIIALLRKAWMQYLEREALPKEACPIVGVFVDGI